MQANSIRKIIKVGNRSELEHWQAVTPHFTTAITQLSATQFLIPGFIDCHIHAPQMPNLGIGLDMQLLDWLRDYTIPLESLYKDTDFAKHVYEKVVVSCGACRKSVFDNEIAFYIGTEKNYNWRNNTGCILRNISQRQFNDSG